MALSAGTRSRDLPRSSAAACSLAFIAACGGSGGPKPAPESARAASDSAASSGACAVEAAPAVPAMHAVSAVQLGAFAERGRAEALRDSLARAGWEAYSRAATVDGRALTRVVVSPTSDAELARYVAAAFARTGREARVVRDSAEREAAADALMEVNRGTHGMAARVRWARSPDGCVLLAVEDPAAVEAEPVPN
ncbi:MAG TPA: SPOR domain-containing protein, partial [Gemmatimonadaceae bacterium]|nr:SPOR domain-containing protein [Gemmatimonadaceae bacterium]